MQRSFIFLHFAYTKAILSRRCKMKLSQKVVILWLWRVIVICTTVFFTLNISDIRNPLLYATVLFAGILFSLLLYLRHKQTKISLNKDTITVKTGIIIHKEQTVHKKNICAAKFFCTPFMKTLRLNSTLLFCEGVRIYLPPLTDKQTSALKRMLSEIET